MVALRMSLRSAQHDESSQYYYRILGGGSTVKRCRKDKARAVPIAEPWQITGKYSKMNAHQFFSL